jgi:TRAP-type C4-dicarboxylate transport system substrate-binding protein
LLGNIEASWKDLSAEEQHEVYQQLGEIQKKDWKELTTDEKKAGEFRRLSIHTV